MTVLFRTVGACIFSVPLLLFVIGACVIGLLDQLPCKLCFFLLPGCFTTVNLAGESGNLSSPGYPDPYPQDYDCQSFLITVSEGSIIRLDFDSFDLGDDDSLVVTDSGKNDALVRL